MSEETRQLYLSEKLAGASRDVALALAFVPQERRELARALHVLKLELEALLFGVRELDVMMTRVQWWREEWERLATGHPRHPLTQTLLAHGDFGASLLDPALLSVVGSLQQDESGLEEYVHAVDGIGIALGRVEGAATASGADERERAWRDVLRADLVLAFGERLARGQVAVPPKLAAELQITTREVRRNEAAGARLVAAMARGLALDASRPAPGNDVWVYRALRQLRLTRAARQLKSPGALRCLGTAWQAARAVRR